MDTADTGLRSQRRAGFITSEAFAEAQKCLRRGWVTVHGHINKQPTQRYQKQFRQYQFQQLLSLAAQRHGVSLDPGYTDKLLESSAQDSAAPGLLEPSPLEPSPLEPSPLEPSPLEPSPLGRVHKRTMEAVERGIPAAGCWFVHDDCAAFVPLLIPNREPHATDVRWDLIFIHPAARAKAKHIHEAEFAHACVSSCGLSVGRVVLLSVNRRYVRQDSIEPERLFVEDDITALVEQNAQTTAGRMQLLRNALLLSLDKIHMCSRPHGCPVCRRLLPDLPRHNVFTLYRGGELSQQLYRQGVRDIRDVPEAAELSERQLLQVDAVKAETPYIDVTRLRAFCSSIQYPLSFLDFETYSVAVPPFSGMRPWQHVPFQFSLHLKESRKSRTRHVLFTESPGRDEREALLTRLLDSLFLTGSIIVFGSSFERTILHSLADSFPQHMDAVHRVTSRIIDLSLPFQNFWYYHPEQLGRLSLKAILPALTAQSYDDLAFSDGLEASVAYYLSSHGRTPTANDDGARITDEMVEQIRNDLGSYCSMDTRALMEILEVLRRSLRA